MFDVTLMIRRTVFVRLDPELLAFSTSSRAVCSFVRWGRGEDEVARRGVMLSNSTSVVFEATFSKN